MAASLNGSSFTLYGWTVCLWSLIVVFQYGYHISVLNQIQAVLTCKSIAPEPLLATTFSRTFVDCIPMSDVTFSILTSIFTVGGLAGSLVANLVMDRWGRRGANQICAITIGIGAALMGLTNSLFFLLLGRVLTGIGSGIGVCVAPIHLAEIAPSRISGSVGILTQLSIVSGIMLTQVAGINLATTSLWRYVFFISTCIALFQLLFTSKIVESPSFLLHKNRIEDHKIARRRLWGETVLSLASEESLLSESEDLHAEPSEENISVPQLFAVNELRKPLMIVSFAMLAQQICGINAVLYYSNDILAKSLPEFGPYISLGITIINVIMTFPPIFLIERLGGRSLLLISSLGALSSLSVLGYGLNSGASTLSSIAIVVFIMSFATGLGPIPFVMIPEVSPPYAVSALSSVALSLNWIINFSVALTFLPIRNFLSGGDQYKEGLVFYVFVVIFALSAFLLFRVYSHL